MENDELSVHVLKNEEINSLDQHRIFKSLSIQIFKCYLRHNFVQIKEIPFRFEGKEEGTDVKRKDEEALTSKKGKLTEEWDEIPGQG
jgi:hypothetical protein